MATGRGAKVVISHILEGTTQSLGSKTTKSNLYWNDDTYGNYLDLSQYPIDEDYVIVGYDTGNYARPEDDEESYVYLRSASTYNVTIYYKAVTLTVRHYLDDSLEESDSYKVAVGHSIEPAADDCSHIQEYDGYDFSKVDVGGTTYNAGSSTSYTFSKNVTFKYYYVSNTVYYDLTVKYVDTNGNSISTSYAKDYPYKAGTTASASTYRYGITGYTYHSSSFTSKTMNGDEELTMTYEKSSDASWGITSSSITSSSAKFTVTLPSGWNKNNYSLIEIGDTLGSSGSIKTVYGSSSPTSSTSTTKTVTITVSGLEPNTEYKLQCRVSLITSSGNSYYITNSRYITFSTLSPYVSGAVYWYDRTNNNTSLGEKEVLSADSRFTMNLTASNYTYTNAGSTYIIAQIVDDKKTEYFPDTTDEDDDGVKNEVIFKPYSNFKVYYYYENTTKASWQCTSYPTMLSWAVVLPLPFTSENYSHIDIIGLDSSKPLKVIYPSSGNTTTITITLGGSDDTQTLTPGKIYSIGCRITLPFGNQYYIGGGNGNFKTTEISDADLIEGCTARWYNYAAGNTGSWSKSKPSFLIKMGDYPFNSKYFKYAGVSETHDDNDGSNFTTPSTTIPGYIRAKNDSPPEVGSDTIILTCESSVEAGELMEYTAFLQTINGTYMPIKAVAPIKSSNEYEFYGATKNDDVKYTSGYEPSEKAEVKLKATDIVSFIRVMNFANLWFKDNYNAGIDYTLVKEGLPIRAITYGGDHDNGIDGFYEKLEEFKGYKNFTQSFSDVEQYSPIVAANLIFLKNSINNMLGVL